MMRKCEELCSPLNLHFFFCYSDEMQKDVNEVELALYKLEKLSKGCMKVTPKNWRDYGIVDNHYSKEKLQDVYDKEIVKCDYVVFLFYNYFGKNTMHEWYLCRTSVNEKPKILLGIKQDEGSRIPLQEMRNIFNSGDHIIDVAYKEIGSFISVVEKELLKLFAEKMKNITALLQNESKRKTLSSEQVEKLEMERERIGSIVNQKVVLGPEFNVPMAPETKFIVPSLGELSGPKKEGRGLSSRRTSSCKGRKL